MKYKVAQVKDIEKVLELHFKYQIDSIKEEDKKDGFITTAFTKEQMKDLIEIEQGLFIAVDDEKIIAYVMSASWKFWSRWPMFEYMIKDLPNLEYLGQKLSVENSYQYGPVCVDKEYRGKKILENLFEFARVNMAKRFPILVTFINKINPRSFEIHKRKIGLEVIKEFSYNNNNYYELVYDISKRKIFIIELDRKINKALDENDYINPTPIQRKVIPLILEHKDIMAKAQTGSGKTASFVLPILQLLLDKEEHKGKAQISTLVLAPTRELAIQISKAFMDFSKYFINKPKVVNIIGGENLTQQLLDIQKGCDIVVATTGRLLDILDKKQINLSKVEFFVLDEADKMLDLGFEVELEELLKSLPKNRQNLLFSATYPQKMLNIASKITTDAIEVFIEDETQTVQTINQRAIVVNKENRSALLRNLIQNHSWDQVLVFMANKRSCDNIAFKFRKYGFVAESFHGDLLQDERNETLEDFKNKKIDILFATDIAARGLHIDDISCVINFDLPRAVADYVHRIGRTGRAGKSGEAISFIGLEDFEHFSLIEKRCDIKLEKEQIKGFELIGAPIKKEKGKEPVKGKRKSKKDKLREKALKD